MANNSKKCVMHLISSSFFGGPEKQIIEHLKRLNNQSYFGVLGTYIENNTYNQLFERAKSSRIKVVAIPTSGPIDFNAQITLNKTIKDLNVNILCTHGYKACVLGYLASKQNNIPILAFSRGYTSENLKVQFYEYLERMVLRRVNGIISVSEGQRQKLKSFGIGNKNTWVVHNAVVTPNNQPTLSKIKKNAILDKLGLPHNSFIVVTAGRLSPEKGHKYLLEAISKSSFNAPKAYYLFCGEGQCFDELNTLSKSLGVDESCRFLGFRDDLQDIFSIMDLFILPSLTEGLPNVVLESFSHSKSVIATNVGGVPEIIKNMVNGIMIKPQNANAIANAINILLKNNELRNTMGQTGFKTVKERFDFSKQTESLLKIYNRVLDNPA